ncbi:MAG: ABC transporter permease [Gemmatimonadota bacterium]|jgi:predicted permease
MSAFENLRRWLRVRRPVSEGASRDVDAEVSFHIEMRASELESSGVPEGEAWRRALAEFGDVTSARRALVRSAARAERRRRRLSWWSDARRDVGQGLRGLGRNPGFATVALLTLGVGLGAAVAIFSVVNGVLLRPLPWADANRLVMVWENDRVTGTVREPASVPDYFDFRDRGSRLFSELAFFAEGDANLTMAGTEPEYVRVAQVTHTLFPLLGVSPVAGRLFEAADDVPGAARTALVSETFWRERLGSDPAVVGRPLMLDGDAYTVLGVLPSEVAFPSAEARIWVPSRMNATSRVRDTHPITVVGRLAPGVTTAAAQAGMSRIAAQLEAEYPRSNAARGVFVEPLTEVVFGSIRPALLVLLGGAGLLLLTACVNVTNLLLARGLARSAEIAVRASLGAGRSRLVRQFVVEGLLLSLGAAVLGVVVARGGLDVLLGVLPANMPRSASVGLDVRVLAVTAAVAVGIGLLYGLVPGLQAGRMNVQATLRDGATRSATGGREGRRIRDLLVVAEIAISVVLLAGAGLLVRTVKALRAVDPGFRTEHVLRTEFQLPESRYPRDYSVYPDWPQTRTFYRTLLDALDRIPGTTAVALAGHDPTNPGFTNSFLIVGRESEAGTQPEISVRAVSAGYFETLGVRLLEGRGIEPGDRTNAPAVAVINEAARRRFFPDGNALGQHLVWWGIDREIVGVVEGERIHGLAAEIPPAVYIALAQAPMSSGVALIRSQRDMAALAAAVRDAVRSADPELAVFDVASLETAVLRSISRERSTMRLLVAFAAVALFLALIGVHGVLGFGVSQRVREMGLRLALGADPGRVVGLVVRRAALLAAAGAAIGTLGAVAASRVLGSLLFGVTALDAATFVAVPLLVVTTALLAASGPARRAARVDPATALRE